MGFYYKSNITGKIIQRIIPSVEENAKELVLSQVNGK